MKNRALLLETAVCLLNDNRDPALCREEIKLIYLSAGNCSYDQDFEHNVKLDRLAIVRLLRSDLPIAVYPCGADNADSIGYGRSSRRKPGAAKTCFAGGIPPP